LSSHSNMFSMPQFGAAWANILSQPMSTRQPQIASTTTIVTISSKTTSAEMSAILLDEYLSPEDREARTKTLKLAARIGYLYETNETFRRELLEAIDEIEAGHFVTFSEDGWEEE